MATENPVFKVLATAGNQAPLAAGNGLGALHNGQVGVFNYHTNLSIDGTAPTDCNDIYLAVGINRTTGGTDLAEDVNKSAGQVIQASRNAKALTIAGYMDETVKIVDLSGFVAKCDSDYLLKINIENQQNALLNGFEPLQKTFSFHTGCCPTSTDCTDCDTTGDPVELAEGLMNNINKDTDKLIVASLVVNSAGATVATDVTTDGTITVVVGSETFSVPVLATDNQTGAATKIAAAINSTTASKYAATSSAAVIKVYSKTANGTVPAITISNAGGTGATLGTPTSAYTSVTDTAAFKLAVPGVSPTLRLTGVTQSRPLMGSTSNGYVQVGTNFSVHPIVGFECNGKVTPIQELVYLQGSGYDIIEKEKFAAGWGKAGPYRTNAITGLANSVELFVSPTGKYTILQLAYDQFSVGGWLEYLNNLLTIVAIPCADSTTLTGLVTILDAIFTRFGAMANDVASMDCTNVSVNTINNYATDGIEVLA